MTLKRKFLRKFFQYVSISLEPVSMLGIVLIVVINEIPGVKEFVPFLAWPVAISIVAFFLLLANRLSRAPERLSGVVLQSHVRKLYFGRCVTGRILFGVRDLKQEKVNVVRIKCGARISKVIIDSAKFIPPGTRLRLKFAMYDAFIRLPIYSIVKADALAT